MTKWTAGALLVSGETEGTAPAGRAHKGSNTPSTRLRALLTCVTRRAWQPPVIHNIHIGPLPYKIFDISAGNLGHQQKESPARGRGAKRWFGWPFGRLGMFHNKQRGASHRPRSAPTSWVVGMAQIIENGHCGETGCECQDDAQCDEQFDHSSHSLGLARVSGLGCTCESTKDPRGRCYRKPGFQKPSRYLGAIECLPSMCWRLSRAPGVEEGTTRVLNGLLPALLDRASL